MRTPSKPRNPLVRHALFKKAGKHQKPEKAQRQQARVALLKQQEVK